MKNIIKSNNPDKPYRLVTAPEVSSCPYSNELEPIELAPIDLTENQKQLLTPVCRTCQVVTYYPKKMVDTLIFALPVYHYVYIVHDKDVTPDGKPKKTHIHLILCFNAQVSLSRVCSVFHTTIVRSLSTYFKNEYDYLTHSSMQCQKEHKHRYDDSELICDDFNYFKSRCPSVSDNPALSMYDDFCNGVPSRDMIAKYGFSFIMQARNLNYIRLNHEVYYEQVKRDKAIFDGFVKLFNECKANGQVPLTSDQLKQMGMEFLSDENN